MTITREKVNQNINKKIGSSINKNITRKERVKFLKDGFRNHPHTIDSERMGLVTEAYKKFDGQEIQIKRANTLKHILDNMSIYIQPNELIVGNVGRIPRAGVLMPENSIYWIENDLETFEIREQDRYVCDSKTKEEIKKDIPYWKGKTKKDAQRIYLSDEAREVDENSEVVFARMGIEYGLGHANISYRKVLEEGFIGIKKEAEEKLAKLYLTKLEDYYQKVCFYKAVIICMEGAINFSKRYARLATELAKKEKDPIRKWELEQISKNCSWAPINPARNFWEAIQAFYITQCVLWIEMDGFSYSPGRFDQYMYPYYEKDKKKGIINYQQALELVDCLFIKLSEIVQLLDTGSAPFWAGDPTGQDLCVGGLDKNGNDATNEMSFICLDALAEVRMIQPNFSVRYHKDTPWDLRLKAAEVIKMGGGMPQNFNDDVMIPALVRRGYRLEDARNWCIIGCVEVAISEDNWGNGGASWNSIAKVLELALNNGVGRYGNNKGKQVGPKTGDPRKFKSYEEVWDALVKQLNYFIDQGAMIINTNDFIHGELTPQPFFSACCLNPIKDGLDATRGGTKYNVICPQAVGTPDVADSLAAIKKVIFDEKLFTMSELIDALDVNFGDCEEIREILINHGPKFGNDDVYVDSIMTEVSEIWCREVEKYKIPHRSKPKQSVNDISNRSLEEINLRNELEIKYGKSCVTDGHHSPGIYTVISNVPFGKLCGALPSGRFAGTPLADGGISPEVGKDLKGPTAIIKSASRIKHILVSNSTLLNQRFNPSTLSGDNGTKNLASLIKTYHDLGGHHIQFNVVSSKTLRDAQKNPKKYEGLMVRVAGYSALFNSLMPEVQDNIVHRLEQGENR